MAKYFTMVFSRCPADGPACLEYALIPEGMRRTIRLAPGVGIGKCTTESPGTVIVNVFQLATGGYNLPKQWQTPAKADKVLVGAVVHAMTVPVPPEPPAKSSAVAYCYREDGKVEYSATPLMPGQVDCSDENPCKDVDDPRKGDKKSKR